ncbi:hypothetical protein IAG44_04915 [Streptomyces roseirectus]|uniref:PLAT domain-containing protein n=1 Tax=Streptomyces roseirectus TaxID=2768066 RepID=A0A7H0I7U2_9ACTN|nr:hypothetical protein [Streptomyces roseirectus]QNP68858.1 hypothetical protein IAG44_04915 [Streptomyces roseirectus]
MPGITKYSLTVTALGALLLSGAVSAPAAHAEAARAESGSFLVRNDGGYVATFDVAYDLDGRRTTEKSGNFTLGVTKELEVPAGATNIDLKVEEYWLPALKTTIFTKHFESPVTECYSIWGTTLAPAYRQISC